MTKDIVDLHEALESPKLVQQDRPIYCFDIPFIREEHANKHYYCRHPVKNFDPNIYMDFALNLVVQLKECIHN